MSQIFMLLISNGGKILSNVNVAVCGQVKSENSSLPVAVHVSKKCVLKLPSVTQITWRKTDVLIKTDSSWQKIYEVLAAPHL